MYHLPTITLVTYRYFAEILVAGVVGWLLSDHVATVIVNHLLFPSYGQYDWYESFMDVIGLVGNFVCIGLSIALIVQFRHPGDA